MQLFFTFPKCHLNPHQHPPASAFHGHPHGLLLRMLGVWNLEFRRVEGTVWRRWLTFWRPGHILGQVETLRAESPSPPNTTCVLRNPSRPHQLHSLQQEFGDTKMCGEQEGLRFTLWLPIEAFWPHKELGDRQAQHSWKAGCCGSLWSQQRHQLLFFPPATLCLPSQMELPPQQAQLSSRMTRLFQALTCSCRADPKKMLAEDVTDLSKSPFILQHFLLCVLRQESHRSGPHSPALELQQAEVSACSKSSQLLLLKTVSPKS